MRAPRGPVSVRFDGAAEDHPRWRFEGFDVKASQIFDLL
jgi:hypothetical protein